jgi:hypothetical protein
MHSRRTAPIFAITSTTGHLTLPLRHVLLFLLVPSLTCICQQAFTSSAAQWKASEPAFEHSEDRDECSFQVRRLPAAVQGIADIPTAVHHTWQHCNLARYSWQLMWHASVNPTHA